MLSDAILEEEQIAHERAEEGSDASLLEQPLDSLPNLRAPLCLSRQASLADAIAAMRAARTGCVLVVDQGRLQGIFTERDVLTRIVGERLDLNQSTLADHMTADPETLTLDDSIAWALNKMAVGGFRHVPLLDRRGRPVGVVAMRDVVDHLVELHPQAVLTLPPSPERNFPKSREGA